MKYILIMLGLWLSFTIGAMAQPALDQNGNAGCGGCGGSTTGPSISISTTGTNELVILMVGGNASSSGGSPLTWTPSGCGLTWTSRTSETGLDSNSHYIGIQEFWGWAATSLSSCTVTTTASRAEDSGDIVQFSLTGVGSSIAPYDANGSLPAVADAGGGNVDSGVSITTGAGDFIFQFTAGTSNTYGSSAEDGGTSLIGEHDDGAHSQYGDIVGYGGSFALAQSSFACCITGTIHSDSGSSNPYITDAASAGGGSSNKPHMIIGGN